MKRTLFAILAIAALAVGCVSPSPLPAPAPGGSTALAPLGVGTPLALASITPEMSPVTDYASLLEHLTNAGATVEEDGFTANSIFTGNGRILKVNGGDVQAFEYSDATAADADAARISPDGGKVGDSVVDWPAPPHFYKQERLLVVYVGNDLQVINPLEFVLGRQFAGSPIGAAAASGTPGAPAATAVAATAQPAPAATTAPAAPAAGSCSDRAMMIQDVTIPDNTVVIPGQVFVKTWRLRNTGTCTWSTAYALSYAKGTNMGAAGDVVFPNSVAPGATIDLSISLTAPAGAGTYRGNYQLRNAAGNLFSISNSGDGTFWVLIRVVGPSLPPTPTPAPTPVSPPRISFPPGSTGISFNVNPPASGSQAYLLAAAAGQELHVGASGPGLVLVVTAPGGTQLAPSSVDAQGLSVFGLPQTGDYTLTFSGAANQVTIVVPALPQPPTPVPTQRITFPPGGTSVTFDVQPPGGKAITYLLKAQAGQEMHVGLSGSGFTFVVKDPNGGPVNPAGVDGSGRSVYPLALAGDYALIFSGSTVHVTIEIPAPAPDTPERITFPAGVTGASRDLSLSAGQTKRYVLAAQANQTMHIVISQPGYTLMVFDPTGNAINPLNSGSGRYDFRLGTTGDYTLALQGSGANTISIEIPPPAPVTRQRITFAAGKTSASVTFTLGGTQTQEYVLGARAGQRMRVIFAAAGTSALVIGPDGRALAPLTVDATGQRADYQLPLTGDYVISLQGSGNTMTVQIPPA